MDGVRLYLLAICCFMLVAAVVGSSDCQKQEFTGCNRSQVSKKCVCSTTMACHNPFEFRDERKCQRALFGDSCRKNDCENKGQCVQTKEGKHICKCVGTGFYGKHCEKKCPKDQSAIPTKDRNSAKDCIF